MKPRHVKPGAAKVACARMVSMEQHEPFHIDRHKSSFNFTLALAMGVAVVGLMGANPFLLIVGLAVAGFSWFTTPARYTLFDDRLVIAYGKPRIRHILFREIDQVDPLKLPIGTRLRVALRSRRPILIQPRDPDEFQSKLEGALESYRSSHSQEQPEQDEKQPDLGEELPPQDEEHSDGSDGWKSRE